MNTLGNLIWLIFGGLYSAFFYFVGGFALCLTIIGIPFGLQCFKLGLLMLWPFGSRIVPGDQSNGCLFMLLNIIWIFCGGLWLAIGHIVFGFLLTITIIGIPFGRQHFKMVEIALMPFGKKIVQEA
ncbi:MAG: YccF domain-containing protein [Flavisolibacter sp.]